MAPHEIRIASGPSLSGSAMALLRIGSGGSLPRETNHYSTEFENPGFLDD
jgi:hypothetical protein